MLSVDISTQCISLHCYFIDRSFIVLKQEMRQLFKSAILGSVQLDWNRENFSWNVCLVQTSWINYCCKKRNISLGSLPKTTGNVLERPGSYHKFMFEFRCKQEGYASLDNTSQLGALIIYPFQYIFRFFLIYPPLFLNSNILW